MSIASTLFGHFLTVSLLAVGGALTVVPDTRRVMVADMGLLTDAQFSESIAIANAAPGPNVLFVAVLGYQAAGLVGAAATLFGMLLPSTTLAYAAARWGQAQRDSRALRAFKAATAPVVIALLFAGAWILAAQAADWRSLALTLAAALLAWRTRLHVLVLIAAGAAVGISGWI
jgi:chromate transporter